MFEDFLSRASIFVNKEALTNSYEPSEIPHRDDQIRQLVQMLAPLLRETTPSNVLIYGKPGTGKTVVTRHVCAQLEMNAQSRNIPLKHLFVNCNMGKIADTEYRLFSTLSSMLGYDVPITGLPTSEVYKTFYKAVDSKRQMILVVLDEIDKLVSKCGDNVLYNLTRINSELKNSKIIVVGISNDVTFKNNLDPRVKSSLSEEEIIFPPYNSLQLKDILMKRSQLAFSKNVISYPVVCKCAAYVGREDGDARRALDLLRISGELAERENSPKIKEKHLDVAQDKLEKDQLLELVKEQPTQSLAIMYTIIKIAEKIENVFFTGDVFDLYTKICNKFGLKPLTQRRVSDLIGELDMLGIINAKVISKGRYGRTREITVSLPDDTTGNIIQYIESKVSD
jgi:cell division control protein 6